MLENSEILTRFGESFNGVTVIHNAQTIQPQLKELISECSSGKEDLIYLNVLINKLLLDIARLSQNSNTSQIDHTNKIKDYIQTSYYNISCLDDIANFVGLNKTYMQRLFKKQMSCTVWEYLTEIRMNAAASLLRCSDICIGDIDECVGINSRQNFYLQFRKTFGMSPQDYRKQIRESAFPVNLGK